VVPAGCRREAEATEAARRAGGHELRHGRAEQPREIRHAHEEECGEDGERDGRQVEELGEVAEAER
jgi:hypothetical protein